MGRILNFIGILIFSLYLGANIFFVHFHIVNKELIRHVHIIWGKDLPKHEHTDEQLTIINSLSFNSSNDDICYHFDFTPILFIIQRIISLNSLDHYKQNTSLCVFLRAPPIH